MNKPNKILERLVKAYPYRSFTIKYVPEGVATYGGDPCFVVTVKPPFGSLIGHHGADLTTVLIDFDWLVQKNMPRSG